jgi:hypothetical protein
MDGCEYDKAFPSGPFGSPSCIDRLSPDESRRQEKKKARRCRGPQANYLNKNWNMVGSVGPDPDKPVGEMEPGPDYNSSTGVYQHAPVTQQYTYETFVGAMDDLPAIRSNVQGQNSLQKDKDLPSFFGANPEDSGTSLTSKRGITESFESGAAPFVNIIGDEEGYKLMPDFAKSFGMNGAQRAAAGATISGPSPVSKETSYLTPTSMLPNSILPVPNVDMFWKENGIAGGQSAFFSQLKAPGGEPAGTVAEKEAPVDAPVGRREVLSKLDKIFARLDDMDSMRSESSQTEVLLFILTGLGVIFLMDIGCRVTANMGRLR